MLAAFLAKPFISGAIGFVRGNWKLILVGVLALVFLSTCARLSNAKSDLVKARAALINPETRKTWRSEALFHKQDFDTCKANTVTLTAALDRQSAAVRALAAESARLTTNATKAAGEARKARAAADRSATALLNYKAVGANQCERTADAIRRAREAVR